MSLHTLPVELMLIIAGHLDRERDLQALVRTHRSLYHALLNELYSNNIRRKGSIGLVYAIWFGEIEAVKRFLQHGADVEVDQDKKQPPEPYRIDLPGSALKLATVKGRADIVALLLEAGADPDSCGTDSTNECDNRLGWNPLHQAVINHDLAIARLLLAHGARQPTFEDIPHQAALHFAVRAKGETTEMVRLLLDHGAYVDAPDAWCETTPLTYAVHKLSGSQTSPYRRDMATPAEVEDNLATVKLLLERGASVEAKDLDGRNRQDKAEGHYDVRIRRLFGFEGARKWREHLAWEVDIP